LDDLGDPHPSDDNSSSGDESPKSKYLEDMSEKEAKSSNESPSDVSVDEDEAEHFKSRASLTEPVEATLTALLQISASTGRGEFCDFSPKGTSIKFNFRLGIAKSNSQANRFPIDPRPLGAALFFHPTFP
jgi:hypothetical protein